ncbi:MAG: adenylate kinase [Candidatus Bathyarchaeia archaeon]
MIILIFGPPGSGKGTYSSRLSHILGIPHISTGDIFREEARRGTPIGREVQEYMTRGELVPDAITVQVLRERIKKPDCTGGFILDGYPRTVEQAKELDRIVKVDVVLVLNIPEDILVEKLTGRRICIKCGEIYNIADIKRTVDGQLFELPAILPRKPGICDKCGGELIQRIDDNTEVIRNRIKVYKEQTEPLINYYRKNNLIVDIYVTSNIEIMIRRILESLERKLNLKIETELI